jgi:adenylate cyclase
MLSTHHGGAEVECSLLFADVRGSTSLAEKLSPMEFTRLMSRFYDTAVSVLVDFDAFVDKFVGDEIIGIFVPAMAGADHVERAITAAQVLLRRAGYPDQPWIPIGAGVNTGLAYVGSIGSANDTELTAMGDVVNTTARLATEAAAGELLVSDVAARKARLVTKGLERRSLVLKGKSEPTPVLVLSDATPAGSR